MLCLAVPQEVGVERLDRLLCSFQWILLVFFAYGC